MTLEDEQHALTAVIDRLAKKFPDRPISVVEAVVSEEYGAVSDGPIRYFVPVLVERAAKGRLRN